MVLNQLSQIEAIYVKNTENMRCVRLNTRPKSADRLNMANSSAEHKVDSKIDYSAMELQRTEALRNRLTTQLRAREVGKSASLRGVVLRFVADGKYQDATDIIDEYLELKSVYPNLQDTSRAHVTHAKELVNAIRAKRNFPNLSQLAMAKQQEILDHVINHFEELKSALKVIEAMVKSEAISDLKSSTWVIRTLTYVFMVVFGVMFMKDFSGSIGTPFWIVFNDFVDKSFQFLIGLF